MSPKWGVITAGEILTPIQGELISGPASSKFTGLSTDTRDIKPGQLFLALKGEYFDGHDFLAKAIEKETRFGIGSSFKVRRDHPVMDEDWSFTALTRKLKDKAWAQLGTSGSGNHFVEVQYVEKVYDEYRLLREETYGAGGSLEKVVEYTYAGGRIVKETYLVGNRTERFLERDFDTHGNAVEERWSTGDGTEYEIVTRTFVEFGPGGEG